MIRYRMLTEEELALRDDKPKYGEFGPEDRRPPVKKSTVKRKHYTRQAEKPPRKVAGRHAARKPKDA